MGIYLLFVSFFIHNESIPAFAGVPTVLAVFLLLSFLLWLSFLLLLAVKLLRSYLLLLVAGFTVACIPAVNGHFCCCLRPFTLVPDVLTVAGLPAIVASLVLLAVLLLLSFLPAVDGILAVAASLLLLAYTQKKIHNPCYQIRYCTKVISTGAILVSFCLQQHALLSQSMR